MVALQLTGALGNAIPQVNTDNQHAKVKHGLEEVLAVREAMIAMANTDPTWFNRPPCKDGRYRFILGIGKAWGVWVLEKTGAYFTEVTAFKTRSQAYVNKIDEDCGNGDWRGHAYG